MHPGFGSTEIDLNVLRLVAFRHLFESLYLSHQMGAVPLSWRTDHALPYALIEQWSANQYAPPLPELRDAGWESFFELVRLVYAQASNNQQEGVALVLESQFRTIRANQWLVRAREYAAIVLPAVLGYAGKAWPSMMDYLPRI